MKLHQLMGMCRKHFWAGETKDPHNSDPFSVEIACLEIVEEYVTDVKTALRLVGELEHYKFPVPQVRGDNNWLEFFTMTLIQSITAQLMTDARISKENRRRQS